MDSIAVAADSCCHPNPRPRAEVRAKPPPPALCQVVFFLQRRGRTPRGVQGTLHSEGEDWGDHAVRGGTESRG